MSRYHWTTTESAIVREHYPKGGVQACMPLLPNRTRGGIHQHARKIGVRAPKGGQRRKPYEVNEFIDAQIRRVYETNPTKGAINELADRLMRPRHWVSRRAALLGLAMPRFKEEPWTDEEIEILSESVHLRPEAIRNRLRKAGYSRTVTAIGVKRKRLGLRQERTDYSANELATLMGVDRKTVTRWIAMGALSAKRAGTKRTEEQGGDEWRISPRQVREFAMNHVHMLDLRKLEPSKHWFIDLLTNYHANNWNRGKKAGAA